MTVTRGWVGGLWRGSGVGMKALRLTSCNKTDCPAVYLADDGTVLAQGVPVDAVEGVSLGPGEIAVQLPREVFLEAVRALEGHSVA